MTYAQSIIRAELQPSDDAPPAYASIPEAPLRVLKFGSSVLRTAADLPRVVGEIYRQRRAGYRIIVVVSALAGETDALLALAEQVGGSREDGVADLVSLGEEKTAALLRIACARLGLDALVLKPERLAIRTSGLQLEADPDSIDLPELARLAARHDLLIMPGFVGIHDDDTRSLLGRGGSDFTAIFIGGESGAECVRLYKDVDGVFDHDPADDAEEARKFAEVSWTDCLEVARPLLQPRSMEYALAKGVRLEVEAIGSDAPTVVGPVTRPPERVVEGRALRVAIAGFGAVGQALVARLRSEPRFDVVSVLVRDAEKHRGPDAPAVLTNSREQFLDAGADILVEVTSDLGVARDLCRLHLASGQDTITANKRLVADHLDELHNAAAGGARLRYSAAAGGGAPVIETVKRARRQAQICELSGVLNGTVNFVLEELSTGTAVDQAIARARRAGFAEADPSEDLSGRDVGAKLRILAAHCFGDLDRLDLQIEALDDDLIGHIQASGERWLQLATLTRVGQSASGCVRFVPARFASGIPPLRREQNYVAVQVDDGRTWVTAGRGAGGLPTAEAIVADLYDIARDAQ